MAKSANKRGAVKAGVKKKAVKSRKAPAAIDKQGKVLKAVSTAVVKARKALTRAEDRVKADIQKVSALRERVVKARVAAAKSRTESSKKALAAARLAVGKATEKLSHSRSEAKTAKLALVVAQAEETVYLAEAKARMGLEELKDELAILAEEDLARANERFIATWSKQRAGIDAKKLKKAAKKAETKIGVVASKAKKKVAAATKKTSSDASVSRKSTLRKKSRTAKAIRT